MEEEYLIIRFQIYFPWTWRTVTRRSPAGRFSSFLLAFCDWGGMSLWFLPGFNSPLAGQAQLCFVLVLLLYKSKVGLQEKFSAQLSCPF